MRKVRRETKIKIVLHRQKFKAMHWQSGGGWPREAVSQFEQLLLHKLEKCSLSRFGWYSNWWNQLPWRITLSVRPSSIVIVMELSNYMAKRAGPPNGFQNLDIVQFAMWYKLDSASVSKTAMMIYIYRILMTSFRSVTCRRDERENCVRFFSTCEITLIDEIGIVREP